MHRACFKLTFKIHVPRGPCGLAHDTMQEAAVTPSLPSQSLPRGSNHHHRTRNAESRYQGQYSVIDTSTVYKMELEGIGRNWKYHRSIMYMCHVHSNVACAAQTNRPSDHMNMRSEISSRSLSIWKNRCLHSTDFSSLIGHHRRSSQ